MARYPQTQNAMRIDPLPWVWHVFSSCHAPDFKEDDFVVDNSQKACCSGAKVPGRCFFFSLFLRKKPYMSAKSAIAAISADS